MKAVKGNKQYTIEESQKKAYEDAGFDIYDDTGEQIAWGRGRSVPYEDHMRAVHEIMDLQALAAARYAENEELKKEIEALQAENEELKKASAEKNAPEPKPGKKQAAQKEGE